MVWSFVGYVVLCDDAGTGHAVEEGDIREMKSSPEAHIYTEDWST